MEIKLFSNSKFAFVCFSNKRTFYRLSWLAVIRKENKYISTEPEKFVSRDRWTFKLRVLRYEKNYFHSSLTRKNLRTRCLLQKDVKRG